MLICRLCGYKATQPYFVVHNQMFFINLEKHPELKIKLA